MVTSNDFEAKLAELEQWFKQHKWLPENIGEFLICIWLVHPIEVNIVANGKANLKKCFLFTFDETLITSLNAESR